MPTYAEWAIKELRNAAQIVSVDCETDTSGKKYVYANGTESRHEPGLDARVSRVTSIALAGQDGPRVKQFLESQEKQAFSAVLGGTHETIAAGMAGYRTYFSLTRPLFVGWNILYFDLPFLHYHEIGSVRFGKTNAYEGVEPKYGYPEWMYPLTWNYAEWDGLSVVDFAPLFKRYAEANGIKHSLKPVAEHLGIEMVNVDASKMHDLSPSEVAAYNLSDAAGVLRMVELVLDNPALVG